MSNRTIAPKTRFQGTYGKLVSARVIRNEIHVSEPRPLTFSMIEKCGKCYGDMLQGSEVIDVTLHIGTGSYKETFYKSYHLDCTPEQFR